jgi:hypothetical protein
MSSSFVLGRRSFTVVPSAENLAVVVSGSFHRHMDKITAAIHEFAAQSVRVLSPSDPRIVAHQGEFLFVASDRLRSVKLVQDRHLDCIRAASFLWLVCPDGYVGVSAAMEIGGAREAGVPVYATHAPNDITMREYVTVMPTLSEAIRRSKGSKRPKRPGGILIDPHASVEQAHEILCRIEAVLTGAPTSSDPAQCVYRDVAKLGEEFSLPALTQ